MFFVFTAVALGAAFTSLGTSLQALALANAAGSVWSNAVAGRAGQRNRPSGPDWSTMVSLVTTLIAVVLILTPAMPQWF